ncbi:four helix bundle protein [Ulvibacterium marinum]|uniref:Four helix bundle protein n=1 Tax=Ulvibacterium marinum TaxID=2419782 RepID=A0A3B0C1E9_9FLAO|nr:four helix bundle protein [Ulvibacterium marinum]RKN78611.1 four helix bundle protein [Ulvibacterium marinum]
MRNFRELKVWQDSRNLVKEVYSLTKKLPETEKYGLVSQVNRCVVSIPANIAEGCSKYSQKDFIRFLQISLGSLFELETHIILCRDLQFIEEKESTQIIEKIQTLQKRVASLIKYNKT